MKAVKPNSPYLGDDESLRRTAAGLLIEGYRRVMIQESHLQPYFHLNWLLAEVSKFLCFIMALVTSGTKGSQMLLMVDEAWKDEG